MNGAMTSQIYRSDYNRLLLHKINAIHFILNRNPVLKSPLPLENTITNVHSLFFIYDLPETKKNSISGMNYFNSYLYVQNKIRFKMYFYYCWTGWNIPDMFCSSTSKQMLWLVYDVFLEVFNKKVTFTPNVSLLILIFLYFSESCILCSIWVDSVCLFEMLQKIGNNVKKYSHVNDSIYNNLMYTIQTSRPIW